jgi:hypothetical protein
MENNPAIIPSGIIRTTVKTIVMKRKINLIGILRMYKPAENNLAKNITHNTNRIIENISIMFTFLHFCHYYVSDFSLCSK